MKKTHFLIIITIVLFSACADPGGDPSYEGFEFAFRNYTDSEQDLELVIGGMKNGIFIPIDSIVMSPKIKGHSNFYYYLDENRWKPNLDKIKAIPSTQCYFKLKLSNGVERLITRYNSSELFSLKLPNNNVYIGDYGSLQLYVYDDKIVGNARAE